MSEKEQHVGDMRIQNMNIRDFTLRSFEKGDLGGEKIQLISKTDPIVSYIVKIGNRSQSVAEYLAQKLLEAVGLYSIPAEQIEINGRIYGAIMYMNGLKRINIQKAEGLTKRQRRIITQHLAISFALYNTEPCEMYFTENDNICSLDYGESALCTPVSEYNLQSKFCEAFTLCNYYLTCSDFTKSDVRYAINDITDNIMQIQSDFQILNKLRDLFIKAVTSSDYELKEDCEYLHFLRNIK